MEMQPLRIVYASPFFDPAVRFGGPVTQLRAICRTLAARGHRVRVVTTDVGVPAHLQRNRWLARDGYHVYYARSSPLGRVAPYYNPNVRVPLQQALRGADVLDMQSVFTHINHVARLIAVRNRVPFVVTPRDALSPVCLSYRRWEKRLFLGLWERRILREATAVHVLTESEREHVAAQGRTRDKSWVIPNACDLAERTRWPPGRTFRETFGISARAPLVLFMSRLHHRKGLDLLCRAFRILRRQVPDAVLAVAGWDEGGARIVKQEAGDLLALGGIRLVGQLSGELKVSALVAADLFTLTSRSEGIPNAVLEALSAGTPCVISEACHIPQVAEVGAGRVTSLEPNEIAEAMADLLRQPERLQRMSSNAIEYARATLRPARVAAELETMYAHCARARQA